MRTLLVSIFALCSSVAIAAQPVPAVQADPKSSSVAAPPAQAAGSLGTQASPEDDLAIRRTFNAYQFALEKKDGKAAAALVDSETVRYYGTVQKLALTADASTVRKQSMIDKLMVLRMRAEFPPEQLKKFSSEELITVGVERGWVGENTAENEVGQIFVNGDLARGQAMVKGEPVPLYHEFRREKGAWKLSLVALTRAVGPVMSEAARRLELSEDEFVMFMLEQGLPKKPGPEIWDAPKPSGKKK